MVLFPSAQSSGNSSMQKSLCVITDIHTASSFLVLFKPSFAFDTLVWFAAALLTVLRYTFCNKRPYHTTTTYSLNIFIANHMLQVLQLDIHCLSSAALYCYAKPTFVTYNVKIEGKANLELLMVNLLPIRFLTEAIVHSIIIS